MDDFGGDASILPIFYIFLIKVVKIIPKKFGYKYYFYYLCAQKLKIHYVNGKN